MVFLGLDPTIEVQRPHHQLVSYCNPCWFEWLEGLDYESIKFPSSLAIDLSPRSHKHPHHLKRGGGRVLPITLLFRLDLLPHLSIQERQKDLDISRSIRVIRLRYLVTLEVCCAVCHCGPVFEKRHSRPPR